MLKVLFIFVKAISIFFSKLAITVNFNPKPFTGENCTSRITQRMRGNKVLRTYFKMLDMAPRNLHRIGTAQHFFKWGGGRGGMTSDFNEWGAEETLVLVSFLGGEKLGGGASTPASPSLSNHYEACDHQMKIIK